MAFGFGPQPQAQNLGDIDYGSALAGLLGRAPGTMAQPLVAVPDNTGPQVDPQATPQPAPQPTPEAASLPDIPVSMMEGIASWLAHGGTPAEGFAQARAVKMENIQNAMALQRAREIYQQEQTLGPRDRLDAYLNGPEFAKADAQNLVPQKAGPDETVIFRGGPGNAGGSQFAGAGTYSVSPTGLISNSQRGVTGRVALPQTVAGKLYPFLPGYSGGQSAPASGWTTYGQQPGALDAISRMTGLTAPQAAGPQPASAQAQNGQGQPGPLDGGQFFRSFVLPHEGGLNPHDMNGAPTKYGINQTANPGVNVPNLTPAQAQDIFVKKYWGPSGSANMPAPLAAVHADTYFINPKMAQTFLKQSGGDPGAYLGLREAWMHNMLQSNPAAAPYQKAWSQRNADLHSFIAQAGQGQSGGAQPQQSADEGDVPTQIGQPIGRTGQPIASAQGRTAAGIPANDHRSYIYDEQGLPKLIPQEYDAGWDRGQRDSFAGWEPVKQYTSVVAPSYQALLKNIGQMTGPAAYAILDTNIRTDNPGATTRQQQLDAFEHKFGIGATFMGKLLNYAGKGSIPKDMQQKIIDSVSAFAQAHYDAANSLYQAQSDLAKAHGRNPADVTIPIGSRPERGIVGDWNGAIPESQALDQARQAIAQGKNRQMVIQRLQSLHIDPSRL